MDQAEASQPRRQTDDYDEQEAKLKGVREVVLAKLGMDDDDSIASTIEVNKSVGIHTDTDEALLKDVRISVLSSLGFDDDPKATIGDTETVQNDTDTDEALLKDVRLSILSSLGFDDDPKATIEAAGTETVRVDTDWTVAPKDEEAPSVQRTSEDSSIPRTDDCAKVVDKEKEILEIGTAVPENNVNRDPLNGSVNSEGLPLPPGETLQRAVLARTLATPGAYAMPGVYHPPGDSGAQQGNERDRETETEEATSSPTQTDHHQEGTEGLVVANMVTDASGPTLDQAEEVTPEELQRNKRHSSVARPLMRFLAAGFVGIAVLVVVLVLVLRNDSEEGGYSNGHSKESTPFPQNDTLPPLPMTAEELVLSLLPNSTVLELSDEQSPQKRAFNWIIQDPLFDNYTDHRILQRYGLATFYYATGGGTKTNWYTDVHWLSYDHHECDWEVENIDWCHSYVINDNESKPVGPCDYNIDEPFISVTPQQMEEGGIYQHLWLFNHELGGYLPEELTLVSTLKSLALLKSQIKGSIPSHLGRLSDLEALFLYSNDLSGTLPTELGMLPNIMHIWSMANPGLTGSLPSEIAQLSTLKQFLTDSCNLTGQIPSELGLMSNLEFFWAWSNPLTGTLPTELGLMTSMQRFGLWNCTLSGSIPTEMGTMESMNELAFDDNPKMVGTIPSELGMLSKLTTLHFGGTSLTGTVPTEITQLPLGSLFLHNSGLSGSLPSELGLLSGLWRLWLFNSSFTGTLATEFGYWKSLEVMKLQVNQFSGPIPSQFGLLEDLVECILHDNSFTGTLATELGLLRKMEYMRLQNNQFSDSIPGEIGTVENLTELLLHDNFFTGTVPKELGLLQKLTTLSVSNNSLTGSIDPALCELGSWLTEGATGIQVDCDLVDCSCDACVCD